MSDLSELRLKKSKIMFSVAILKTRRLIVVPTEWIEHPTNGKLTKIYFSPNEESEANFDLEVKYLLDKNHANNYEGFFLSVFDTMEDAEKYIRNKRKVMPINYNAKEYDHQSNPNIKAKKPNKEELKHLKPLETITLSDSDDETDAEANNIAQVIFITSKLFNHWRNII